MQEECSIRQWSWQDRLIGEFDRMLQTLSASQRSNVIESAEENLSAADRVQAGRLMRVNHAGEVCAQALYRGHAWLATHPSTQAHFLQAAYEEEMHLLGCEQRLQALGTHPSYLGIFWYTGSFMIGAGVGLLGEPWSLGFVAETEKQVTEHLAKHLQRWPRADKQSMQLLKQMQADEAQHATQALGKGGRVLPGAVQWLMRQTAGVMTKIAYWF